MMQDLVTKRHKKLVLKLPLTAELLALIVDNQLKTRNYLDLSKFKQLNSPLFYSQEGFINKLERLDETLEYHLSRHNYSLSLDILESNPTNQNLTLFYSYFILNSCSSLQLLTQHYYQVDYCPEILSKLDNPGLNDQPSTNLISQINNVLQSGKPGKYDRKVSAPVFYVPPRKRLDYDTNFAIKVFTKLVGSVFPKKIIYDMIIAFHAQRRTARDVEIIEELVCQHGMGNCRMVLEDMYRKLDQGDKADLLGLFEVTRQ